MVILTYLSATKPHIGDPMAYETDMTAIIVPIMIGKSLN